MSSTPKPFIPLRSPTPPLDSSSDELNELSLEQELAHLDRPHFLDYTQIGIPYPVNDNPPPIPPRNPLTNSLPSTARHRSSIPVKMFRSADNVPSDLPPPPPLPGGKKHFLDENPIRPDYEYDRPHRSLDRQHVRNEMKDNNGSKSQFNGARRHSAERPKQKKIKEPSYTLSRFLENEDGFSHQYNDNEVCLNDVNLTCGNAPATINPTVDVYSILSMIGCNNPVEMSRKFLDLSKSPHTCATLRHSRCIPLLVQMIHFESDDLTKKQAREALRNVVNYHPDDKVGRREAKVLRYIEQIMDYCDLLRKSQENENKRIAALDSDNHPSQAMSSLMKISFDEEHRHAMCQLGALQTIANLVHLDHAVHGTNPNDAKCISLRRYAGMALTNLTFGDGNNKALLCANRDFMKALVAQITTDADDLLQVTANVLRNLSWRADNDMKTVLNEIGTVSALTIAAMKNKNETTLRAILSALWNLSAHCSKNKAEFCLVDGALLFLVEMLTYDAPSKTLSIVENAGGILRNVSSHIAVNEDFRKILRQRNCLGILLQQLKSESLTIVSNACGTLWNLSARCPEDQQFLWDNGAVPMLRSLVHSKHKMISNGSKVALKNLINFRPGEMNRSGLDPVARSMGLKELPTLSARKQRALEDELHVNLVDACDANEVSRTPPPLINQKPPKSFTPLETDQQFVERNFTHLSLQCNPRNERIMKAEYWDINQMSDDTDLMSPNTDVTISCSGSHATGTIPKKGLKPDSNEVKGEQTNKTHQTDAADQITNFSLLYSENPGEIRDVKTQKERTFSVAEDDTIKCYDNEETPLLSTATSISDLRPTVPKHPNVHAMHRHSKSGRTTTENSGINTPERPINYCDEGTPAYFSRRDSFSSLAEEAEFAQDGILPTHNANRSRITHKIQLSQSNGENQRNVAHSRQESGNDGSNSCTVPTTPGECPSKSVKFNEYNLETPMMFSRHSSLGSLASNEPALNDDIGSVVSEISRMPSGIISPSEIPDSPSQTMPQSPRQKTIDEIPQDERPCTSTATTRRLPFEDEVKTFGVESTPALISCATSLSNLSLDDEPKIANDSLIKEMRLMHQMSDDQEIELATNAIASASLSNANIDANIEVECDAGEALSDSDESIDGENDELLNNCINIGIACGNQGKNLESGIKSPPALPEPNQILRYDHHSSDEDCNDDEQLLEQCIQAGINTSTVKRNELPPQQENVLPMRSFMVKENPIGMLRKGGPAFIEMNNDEMNRFNYEDSPCNYSVMSGLSDLTVGSHTARLFKPQCVPSNQQNPNVGLNPIQSHSIPSEQGIHSINQLNSTVQSNTTSSQSSNVVTVRSQNSSSSGGDHPKEEDVSSDDEIDEDDENLLEQCIQAGITGTKDTTAKVYDTSTKPQALASVQPKVLNESSNINGSLSSIDSVGEDELLLEECIQAGINAPNALLCAQNPNNELSKMGLNQTEANSIQMPTVKSNKGLEQNAKKTSKNDLSSDEENSDDEALLEQCILAGINITAKPPVKNQEAGSVQMKKTSIQSGVGKENPKIGSQNSSPIKRSQLPTFKTTTASGHRSRSTKRDEDDVQLLKDSLNNKGIDRTNRMKSTLTENKMQNLPVNDLDGNSKNAQTTSAVVSCTVGAPDVVMNKQKGTEICAPGRYQTADTAAAQIMNSRKEPNTVHDETHETKASAAPNEIGYNNANSMLTTSLLSIKSQNSFNMSSEIPLLERSNEYPAFLEHNESITDSQHSSSIDMEVSNECLFDGLSPLKNGKYKDPNLMLQSVDRFTHELVSTAEYLRTANGSNVNDDDDITITETKFSYSTSEKGTWNEDSNPNAISFPSISMTAPVIASMHDDDDVTISDSNMKSRYEMASSEFIEDSTPTNPQKTMGISFEIGGKINGNNFVSGNYNCNDIDSHDTNSTMTNSTIIAMEADKIRTLIMNDQNRTDSIISLDKIRPPSVMEKMTNSSNCDSLNGPSSLKGSPGRYLAQGFMARRALQNNCANSAHGSTDSINSSCNLDRVKPPSIMDDLLDSMISVDSIASEYVDNPIPQPAEEQSHYETAFSECDDMTTTLKSCAELPFDNTPCGSDFSSVESTPKKGRRSITPRRKRQMTKDRYQTYTIATGESGAAVQSLENRNYQNADSNAIFHMQMSNHPLLIHDNDSDAISLVSTDDGEMSSIRAFTRNLPYLNNITVPVHQDFSINTNTYTRPSRSKQQKSLQSNADNFQGLPNIDVESHSNASSNTASPNHTITKSPRIVKPTYNVNLNGNVCGNGAGVPVENTEDASHNGEPKGIRGRKKPAYVSPYAMSKLTKTAPAPSKPITRNITPKIEPAKVQTPPKPVESKPKSFIQRSAESLKKIKPAIASKLSRQNSVKKSSDIYGGKTSLDRQKSSESVKSSETLIRQSTFIKDEPSEGEIPVIVSEPTSPKKTKTLASRIPFNRTTSLQATRNVTKCKTNIEIPLQKSASSSFARRTMKTASSTSQISSPTTSKLSLSPRQTVESPSTSKSIFRKWSPSAKNISAPLPSNASKIPAGSSRESIASGSATKKITSTLNFRSTATASYAPSKPTKLVATRTITTNGRTTKV